MPGTFHSFLSNRSQRRSPSLVSDARSRGLSSRGRTEVESTARLPDPNGPPWHVHLSQKLFRDKRLDDIPGWFDRWDLFLGANDLTDSILCVASEPEQAALRRSVWLGVVLHSALIVALFAIAVFVPTLAAYILDAFCTAWHHLALYVSLVVEIVLVKLTLDTPFLRRLLILVYSATLGVLLASVQLAVNHPTVFYCCALAIVPQLVVLLLCGVQRKLGGGAAEFLGHLSVGFASAIITTIAAISAHYSSASPGLFTDHDHLALAVLALVSTSFVCAYEASLLFRTLARDETWLGLYCVHFDIHVVTLVIPIILIAMIVSGIVGLAVGAPIELLRQAYSNVWKLYTGSSTFGLIWHLDCLRHHTARVDIDLGSDAGTDQDTKENE